MLIVLVYVDDIIFGCNKDSLVQWFASAMESEFEMSMIGELSFFSWSANYSEARRDVHFSRKISKRNAEKVSNGRF